MLVAIVVAWILGVRVCGSGGGCRVDDDERQASGWGKGNACTRPEAVITWSVARELHPRASEALVRRKMLPVAESVIRIHFCMHTLRFCKIGESESKIVLSALRTHDSVQPAPLTTDCT